MSRSLRQRRDAYDNIAKGASVDTNENTILGNTVSKFEMYGGGYVVSTSDGEHAHSNISAGILVTDDNGPDNMTAAVDPTDERVGSSNVQGYVT